MRACDLHLITKLHTALQLQQHCLLHTAQSARQAAIPAWPPRAGRPRGGMVRFKNRYLILFVKAKDGRPYDSIGAGLLPAIKHHVGVHQGEEALEAASPSLQVMFYHHLAGVAIVRVGRSEHREVLQTVLKMGNVDYKPVHVKLLKLTGAFRVAKRSAAEHIERLLAGVKLPPQHQAAATALQERLAAMHL